MKRAFCAFFMMAAFLVTTPAAANVDPRGKDGSPRITQLLLDKSARRLYLLQGRTPVRSYVVDLGPNPTGHKENRGDGRTPEGLYHITHRNPGSSFFLSLGISYPNAQDRARAHALGRDPGGDIFIHGRGPEGNRFAQTNRDWTAGCIAVKDEEIEEVYAMLRPGIPIVINP